MQKERKYLIEYLANKIVGMFNDKQILKLLPYFISIHGLYKERGISTEEIYRYIIRAVKLNYRQQVILYSVLADYSLLSDKEKGEFLRLVVEKMLEK